MHYKICFTCIYNWHLFYTLLLLHGNLIHLFHNSAIRVMNLRAAGQCLYTIVASNNIINILRTVNTAEPTSLWLCTTTLNPSIDFGHTQTWWQNRRFTVTFMYNNLINTLSCTHIDLIFSLIVNKWKQKQVSLLHVLESDHFYNEFSQ